MPLVGRVPSTLPTGHSAYSLLGNEHLGRL